MLLVKTIVKESPIAGLGLFADEPIKKGQRIWEFHPETCLVLTEKQLKSWQDSSQKQEMDIINYYYLKHGYYEVNKNAIVFCLDNSRFINTVSQPNILSYPEVSIAARDIAKGEEITENYEDYGAAEWYKKLMPTLLSKGDTSKKVIL